ncbi:MAG: hypothetical protein IT429_06935 [Gemmataceae bacterium]|nr:hypothetical protein [Gemmataceae bacterium]
MLRWFGLCTLLPAILITVGCSSSGEQPVTVSGTVHLDGKPLPEGTIAFVGEPGTSPDVLSIKNGVFEGSAFVGKKKVEISAYRAVKASPTATDTSPQENYIPARFNAESFLKAEITTAGVKPNKFDVSVK